MGLSAVALKVLEAGLGWVVGRAGDAGVKRLIGRGQARKELTQIAAQAIAEALVVAPELGPDLETTVYANQVLGPVVLQVVAERDASFDAPALAASFTSRFVVPYLRSRSIDHVLAKIYRLEPARLDQAFQVMATQLRSGLLRSEHWSDIVKGAVLDDILLGVIDLQARAPRPPSAAEVLDEARQDARHGSDGLRSWPQTIARLHIDRPEEEELRRRVLDHPGAATLLIGVAGSGKSALLAGLVGRLEQDGMTVFAIKADQLPPDVASYADISRALGMQRPIDQEIERLAAVEPVAVIIDQLDAVSEVMDSSGRRMRLLLNLARRLTDRDDGPPVHVVISSRPFEARYDARFDTLDADTFDLRLPPYDRIQALLRDLGIDPAIVPEGLKKTLRRPFLLKLFVQLVDRKAVPANLVEGELLNAWLASAPLGNDAHRRAVYDLLQAMARQMTASETLWLPADWIEAEAPEALRRAEACELVVRSGLKLGFAHQSWLDDFQARGFATAADLAAHAWAVQDALFNRATILRALERLRQVDTPVYGEALDLLLGDARTRRHLRHLVTDLIASQPAPLDRELAWVRRLIQDDAPLARRAIASIVGQWSGWRDGLIPLLPQVLHADGLSFQAGMMVVAEAQTHSASAEDLLLRHWDSSERDFEAFDIISRAKLWSAAIEARLRRVFARGELTTWALSAFLTDLVDGGRAETAVDLLGTFLKAAPYSKDHDLALHDLEKVVQAAPRRFVEVVLPWFLTIVGAPEAIETVRDGYPHSPNLPFSWNDPQDDGTVFACLGAAVDAVAQSEPEFFLKVVGQVEEICVEEVQGLIADGFAAAGAGLADAALEWLLRDPRRFQVGQAHVDDEDGVGHLVSDWATRSLLIETSPHADRALVERVRDALEAWDGYQDWVWEDEGVDLRRQRRQWAEARRAVLLDLLPVGVLSARRRRQVREIVELEPRLERNGGRRMASLVRSPMSSSSMGKANDADIMKMLDQAPDGSERFRRPWRRRGDGGFVELARAFADFGLEHPDRAIALVRRCFVAGRHEYAGGHLIHKLAEKASVSDKVLLSLIRDLVGRGFGSESFRYDIAWALQSIAERRKGLDDQELELLESWVVSDPSVIGDRIAKAKLRQAQNDERNAKKERPKPFAVLFRRGAGAMTLLPHGNYPLLSAISAGLLAQEPPAAERWLELLERHADRVEEPEVWSTLMPRYGWALQNLDRPRVQALFDRLWRANPDAFNERSCGFLWQGRHLLSESTRTAMVDRWLSSSDPKTQQLGGEYAMALALVDDVRREAVFADLASGEDTPDNLGRAFTAAAGWRSEETTLRATAHTALLPIVARVTGDMAQAVATVLALREPFIPDTKTQEVLEAARNNDAMVAAFMKESFLGALQALLLEAGFESLVLDFCEKIVELNRSPGGRQHGERLVSLSVALQRGDERQKGRAIELYEKLLDLDAYGAHEAAKATLQR